MKGIAVRTLPPSTSVPAKAHTKNGKELERSERSGTLRPPDAMALQWLRLFVELKDEIKGEN